LHSKINFTTQADIAVKKGIFKFILIVDEEILATEKQQFT